MGRLFIYGTLRPGEVRHSLILRLRPTRITPARASGRLLDLGDYPGMIEGKGSIAGELVEFEDNGRLLAELDEVEGSRFRRARIAVETHGTMVAAWTYLWTGGRGGGRLIGSGDWKKRD